jgi:hypothetical protein
MSHQSLHQCSGTKLQPCQDEAKYLIHTAAGTDILAARPRQLAAKAACFAALLLVGGLLGEAFVTCTALQIVHLLPM